MLPQVHICMTPIEVSKGADIPRAAWPSAVCVFVLLVFRFPG